MIFVTGIELRGRQEVISGVLLDSLPPGGYPKDVFNAFLSSDRIREIVCEKPQYEGGHGHTRDGLMISAFTSQLHGGGEYSHERFSLANILTQVVENRIELVTTANLDDCIYPAFLAFEAISPPVATRVIVKLEITRIGCFPDVQAFAQTDPHILDQPSINSSVQCGTILPVQCGVQGTPFMGALKLLKQFSPNDFEALIYHERDKGPILAGRVLKRTVIKQKRGTHGEQVEYSAKIGTVIGIQ